MKEKKSLGHHFLHPKAAVEMLIDACWVYEATFTVSSAIEAPPCNWGWTCDGMKTGRRVFVFMSAPLSPSVTALGNQAKLLRLSGSVGMGLTGRTLLVLLFGSKKIFLPGFTLQDLTKPQVFYWQIWVTRMVPCCNSTDYKRSRKRQPKTIKRVHLLWQTTADENGCKI